MGGYLNAFVLFAFAAALGLPFVWLFRVPKRRKWARPTINGGQASTRCRIRPRQRKRR